MRVLVTGGCGFIGSHSVQALLDANISVRVLDDLSSGSQDNLPASVGVEFVEGDVRDRTAVIEAMRDITHVLHLAAQVSVPASMASPRFSCSVNVNGFLNVIESATAAGAKRVVYASSAAVFGENSSTSLIETTPRAPTSPYGLEKAINEEYAALFQRLHGLSTLGLRYFNVYGPGQNPTSQYSGVVSKFVDAGCSGRALEIFGDGLQTRDFVYVKDVAAVNRRALLSRSVGVCNVGTGKSTSIMELAFTLGKWFGSEPEITHQCARTGDIRHSSTQVDHLRRALGYVPKTELVVGLKHTCESGHSRSEIAQ